MDLREAARVLGVTPADPKHIVKRQYRRLARATHPDRHPGIDPVRFRRVREAWDAFEAAWDAPVVEPVRTPDRPGRMGVVEWLSAGGIHIDQIASDLLSSGALARLLPERGPNPVYQVCEAYDRRLELAWPTISSSFRTWFQSNIAGTYARAWDGVRDGAMGIQYIEDDVYQVLLEHVVFRTAGIRRLGHQVTFGGDPPPPQYSDEVRRVGLLTVIRNRVALAVDRRIRTGRLDVINQLDRALEDPMKLMARWNLGQNGRFTSAHPAAV